MVGWSIGAVIDTLSMAGRGFYDRKLYSGPYACYHYSDHDVLDIHRMCMCVRSVDPPAITSL